MLEDQRTLAETVKREGGTLARYVFCYATGKKTGQRIHRERLQQGVAEGPRGRRLPGAHPA